ncbi:MAG: hypothetical protein Q8P30_00510 [Candidatus Uhrbacteria bacterium]|nr:hypothetical protein [Candidatus Uhrbacteria bacterium]
MSKGGSGESLKNIAHVVAVNMGYGHERPAHVLRRFAVGGKIIIANEYEGIPEHDKRLWDNGRKIYEKISRFKKVPILGRVVFSLMDELQKIPEFYPRRDLSSPSLQVRELYYLIRQKDHMRHLIEKLSKNPKPLVCTFMSPAFAAEEFGYPEEIFCLCTDADVNRAWAPLHPRKSRIRYFAPNGRVVERLQLYGVSPGNVELTGFPLPTENVGGLDAKVALVDLQRRICNLDPNGIFVAHTGQALTTYLGPQYCKNIKTKPSQAINLAFAIGGAGAQRENGIVIAKSLSRAIKQGKIILHLVAGTRPDVDEYFRKEIRNIGLGDALKKGGINILFEKDRAEYFENFTKLMRKIDILWTKPSELSFYTGLGIPVIMAPTVGSQEDYNHKWLEQVGGGIDQLDPRYANEWLFDWIESGALASKAWNGFIEAPTHGAYRIADVLMGRPNTIHELPLVV